MSDPSQDRDTIANLKQDISDLQREMNELDAAVRQKRKDLATANDNLNKATKENGRLLDEELKLRKLRNEATRQTEEAQLASTRAQATLNQLNQEIQDLETKKETLTNQIDDQTTALKEIEDKIADPALQTLKQEAEDAENRKSRAEAAADAAKQEQTAAEDSRDQATEAVRKAEELREEIRREVDTLSQQRRSMRFVGRLMILLTIALYGALFSIVFWAMSLVAQWTGAHRFILALFVLLFCVLVWLLERASGRIANRTQGGGMLYSFLLRIVPIGLILSIVLVVVGLVAVKIPLRELSAEGIAKSITEFPARVIGNPLASWMEEVKKENDEKVTANWINGGKGEAENIGGLIKAFESDAAVEKQQRKIAKEVTLSSDPALIVGGKKKLKSLLEVTLVPRVRGHHGALEQALKEPGQKYTLSKPTADRVAQIKEHLEKPIDDSDPAKLDQRITEFLEDLKVLKEIREGKMPQ